MATPGICMDWPDNYIVNDIKLSQQVDYIIIDHFGVSDPLGDCGIPFFEKIVLLEVLSLHIFAFTQVILLLSYISGHFFDHEWLY